jgi:hypothetical protein
MELWFLFYFILFLRTVWGRGEHDAGGDGCDDDEREQ